MAGMVIGIDLGTTNSAVCVWRYGQAELIPNKDGKWLTPSVVGLDDNGNIIVGQAAQLRLQSHPHLTKASFKRCMGTDIRLVLGTQGFRAEELSALLLRQLKEDACIALGESVTDAVITVPAYFNDVQRRAVKSAGELSGLNVCRLLNEPTAASLAFGLLNNQEQKYLTFDLGGGTFDVSIIDMFEGVIEVRSSSGDVHLGGDDFSEAICDWMFAQYPALQEELDALWPRLLAKAEYMKCKLSVQNEVSTQLEWEGRNWTWLLNDDLFLVCCQPLLNRLQQPILQALNDARISPHDLDAILLVGGATRMPLVRQTVARLFGIFPRYDLNPDDAVALGAGIQAGMVMTDSAVDDVVLTDVMPFSLGVEVNKAGPGRSQRGYFMPIIERNTFLPVSKVDTVVSASDHQRIMKVKIYQGEGRRVEDNILLGEMDIDIPPRPAGEVEVDIRFTYTLDGLLEVECHHSYNPIPYRLMIEKVPGQMSEEDMTASLLKLSHLKQHPRDRPENRAILARCAKLYAFFIGDRREKVDQLAEMFETALELQDLRQIAMVRQHVERNLDILERGMQW